MQKLNEMTIRNIAKRDIVGAIVTVTTEHELLPFQGPADGPCILDLGGITLQVAEAFKPADVQLDSLLITAIFRAHGMHGIRGLLDPWNSADAFYAIRAKQLKTTLRIERQSGTIRVSTRYLNMVVPC